MIRVGFQWIARGSCSHPEAMTIAGGSLCAADFPSMVGVIRHPSRGVFLFDTGYDPAFIDATQPFPERLYRWTTPVRIGVDAEWSAWLAAHDIVEADLADDAAEVDAGGGHAAGNLTLGDGSVREEQPDEDENDRDGYGDEQKLGLAGHDRGCASRERGVDWAHCSGSGHYASHPAWRHGCDTENGFREHGNLLLRGAASIQCRG